MVESELAAKSTIQTNQDILNFINSLPSSSHVLDYGCGKLRYSIILAQQVKEVVAIDSFYQLNKLQTINGTKTTVITYSEKYSDNIRTYCVDSVTWMNELYNIVFCINVLSAIPNDSDRLHVLQNARKVLAEDGYILITVQYRNSYFKKYKQRVHTITHNDGWLVHLKDNKYSFYGILSEEKITQLCDLSGLVVKSVFRRNGSIFIKAYNTSSS